MNRRDEWKVGGIVLLVFSLLYLAAVTIFAHQESATYNRLTGAHTTAWDALWVELRVQGTNEGKSK